MFSYQVPGDRHAETSYRIRYPKLHMPVWMYLVGLGLKWAGKGLWWLVKNAVTFWWITLPLLPLTYLYLAHGWEWALTAVVSVSAGLALWWWRHGRTFWRYLGWFYLAQGRRYWTYQGQWQATCENLNLAKAFAGNKRYPKVVKVRRDAEGDLITVRTLAGQFPADWTQHAERFAYTYGAMACTIYPATGRFARGRLVLHMRVRDALAEIVAPLAVPQTPNLKKLPVAIEASKSEVQISLITHVLIVGRTGAGKGSALWSILAALANGARSGLVQLHAFDPKGGVELAFGKALFHRFYYGNPAAMADALEDLVTLMRQRQDAKRGKTRDHVPTMEEPAVVIVVDEFAALTAYVGNKQIKERIALAMSTLLTQGRAMGVHVIAALQDPRKEILPFRNLFGVRVALALNETSETDLALDDDATLRGAHCHLIPEETPGVAYMIGRDKEQPLRIRFPYHSDDNIKMLAQTYGVVNDETVASQELQTRQTKVEPGWVINR